MIKVYAIIIVIGLLGGVAYGAKYYYDTTQNTIAQLRDNNAKLEVANETNQATIRQMDVDNEVLNALTDQLSLDLQKAEQYGDELRHTLNKHDLTHLANKKPGMIEKRVNDATQQVFESIENDSKELDSLDDITTDINPNN